MMTIQEFRRFLTENKLTADWRGDAKMQDEKDYFLVRAGGVVGSFWWDGSLPVVIHVKLD